MTVHDTAVSLKRPKVGEPTWEMARFFPHQGDWTVEEYLRLNTNHLVEFTDGLLEFLPLPTEVHQFILLFLFDALRSFVQRRKLGIVLPSPLRVRLGAGRFREPDVVFMSNDHVARHNKYWEGADLVMEIVSPDDPKRDRVQKRQEYAAAGILEYWIVDPQRRQITVLALSGKSYAEHGVFEPGQNATSALLKGFRVGVSAVFKAGNRARP
jgi:Uma2 family endonuclease